MFARVAHQRPDSATADGGHQCGSEFGHRRRSGHALSGCTTHGVWPPITGCCSCLARRAVFRVVGCGGWKLRRQREELRVRVPCLVPSCSHSHQPAGSRVQHAAARMTFSPCCGARRYIRQYSDAHGPFDGVVGFSQGACVAAALCAQASPLCLGPLAPLPSLRWAVFISGFPAKDAGVRADLDAANPVREIPAVFVHGARDFNRAGSLELSKYWTTGEATSIEHAGGHVVPRLAAHGGAAEVLEAIKRLVLGYPGR